ncbi:MAG: outer membrane beta-barrel domain-containing protein [Pseudomonadales bacterium]|nr:outer membrane beta-barrel domain-containing protein [Halioglobus sp.]MCP5121803.1 outer membrane beta-barrel domain-containing protein [Pseudomonadales bacterium]MCP5192658.1 outer membrane beta-barrel domain-containing protein [Pseudomonadales bacterium]
MENRHKRVFLAAAVCSALTAPIHAEEQRESWQILDPGIERQEFSSPAINRDDFEIGPYIGMLSIQDFNSDVLYGMRAAWHINEDFFFEGNYGSSQADLTSYEKLSGGAPLFDDSERDYTFYDLNLGWNALPGEIFILDVYALKSDFYFVGGAGSTDFLGDNFFTLIVGAGFRMLLNDWISWRFDVRDHIFDRDAFGNNETTNNIELSTGVTFLF